MDRTEWLVALRDEGERFGNAVRSADPTTPIPSCPEWTMTDLVGHMTWVYQRVSDQVRRGNTERPERVEYTPPAGDPAEQYALALEQVQRTLSELDPEAPAWNFSRTAAQTVGFWPRRMAHETAIHRWDAELGQTTDFPPSLAADGVGEVLESVLSVRAHREPLASAKTAVRVECTDTGDAWLVTLTPGQVDTRRVDDPVAAPTVVRGPSAHLYLALWGREPVERYTTSGDPGPAALLRVG